MSPSIFLTAGVYKLWLLQPNTNHHSLHSSRLTVGGGTRPSCAERTKPSYQVHTTNSAQRETDVQSKSSFLFGTKSVRVGLKHEKLKSQHEQQIPYKFDDRMNDGARSSRNTREDAGRLEAAPLPEIPMALGGERRRNPQLPQPF